MLAAERTLLSWLHLGVAVMGLGFVVERFDLFLRTLSAKYAAAVPFASSHWTGISIILGGAILCALPAREYRRLVRAQGPDLAPYWYRTGLGSAAGIGLAVVGVSLAVYLQLTAPVLP